MKPIEYDKTSALFIQKLAAQPKAVMPKAHDGQAVNFKNTTHQMSDLIQLILNSTSNVNDNERIKQIKLEISENKFNINVEMLADNLLIELQQDLAHEF